MKNLVLHQLKLLELKCTLFNLFEGKLYSSSDLHKSEFKMSRFFPKLFNEDLYRGLRRNRHNFCFSCFLFVCKKTNTSSRYFLSLDIYKIEKKIKNNFLIYIEKLTFLHKVYKKKHSRHLLIKILGGFTHESIFIFIF